MLLRRLLSVLLFACCCSLPLVVSAAVPQSETAQILCFQPDNVTAADCDLLADAAGQTAAPWTVQRVIGAELTQVTSLHDSAVLVISRGSRDELARLSGAQRARIEGYVREGGRLILHDAALAADLDQALQAPLISAQMPQATELTRAGALVTGATNGSQFTLPTVGSQRVPISQLGSGWQVLARGGAGALQAAVVARASLGEGKLALAPHGFGDKEITWAVIDAICCHVATLDEIRIDAIEVTQAVQDLHNSVSLVTDKETFVRVHTSANVDTPNVTAVLRAFRNGMLLLPYNLAPHSSSGTTVYEDPDRGSLSDTFNFALPDNWVNSSGNLMLVAEIYPAHATEDFLASNNVMTETVNLIEGPALKLRTHNMVYEYLGSEYRVARADITRMHRWIEAALPISDLDATRRVYDYGSGTLDATVVNNLLALIWLAEVLAGMDEETHFYGIVSDSGMFMRGRAIGIPSKIASGPNGSGTFGWDYDGTYGDWYGLHELGHTLGRYHAEFCGANGGAAFPYPDGRISDDLTGDDALYGFNTEDIAVYGPDWTDMMSYCEFQWVSDYTYEGILSYMLAEYGTASAPPPPVSTARNAAPTKMLALVGNLELARRTGSIFSAHVLEGTAAATPDGEGPYSLALVGRNGDLATYRFSPSESHDHDDPRKPAQFAEIVPWEDGTVAIEIRSGPKLIARREVSPNAPQVTVTPFASSELTRTLVTLNWTATDADNDELTALVQRGDEQAGWQTVAAGLRESPAPIDLDGTGGGTFKLRVIVSDGVNTGVAETGSLTLPAPPPTVTLRGLPEDAVVYPTDLVVLQADITDAGRDATVQWLSSRDGELGSGRRLETNALSTGTHLITATVNDGDNRVVEAVRRIVVAPGTQAPTPQIAVSHTALAMQLTPADSSRATIVHLRVPAGGASSWLATTTASWLKLGATSTAAPGSSAQGTFPGQVRLVVDPKNLALGDYSTTVNITAGQMTRQIRVTLTVAPAPVQQLIPGATR